jgi:hypothetical protein
MSLGASDQVPTIKQSSSTSPPEVPMDVDLPQDSEIAPTVSGEESLPGSKAGPAITIDISFEASKLPLDVAIYNSARAAGEEKIKKYLQAVLVIGGSALIPGMTHALESRLDIRLFSLDAGLNAKRLDYQVTGHSHTTYTEYGKGPNNLSSQRR